MCSLLRKKKKKNKKFGFTGSNAAVSQMLSCSPDGWKETQQIEEHPRQTAMKIYIHIYIYMHLCTQTQAGTTVKVGLALRLQPLPCRLCCSVWTGYTERNQHPRRSQSFGYTMKLALTSFRCLKSIKPQKSHFPIKDI